MLVRQRPATPPVAAVARIPASAAVITATAPAQDAPVSSFPHKKRKGRSKFRPAFSFGNGFNVKVI
jgi:hypothetical protein